MKILVFAHQLEIGGTQTNAIELAVTLRDLHGYEVVLFRDAGTNGQNGRAERAALPAGSRCTHPSVASPYAALRHAVRRERPDLVHVWDWWQCLDAYYAVHLPMGVPMVVTDMNMGLTVCCPRATDYLRDAGAPGPGKGDGLSAAGADPSAGRRASERSWSCRSTALSRRSASTTATSRW